MPIDQAEEIRQRLEARRAGSTYIPPPELPEPPPERNLSGKPAEYSAQPSPVTPVLSAPKKTKEGPSEVVIIDVQIKFWSLVVLMVKVAFAAIPAMFIVAAIWWVIAFVMVGVFHR
ncbi:MAG TPA: hypothetical protein PLD30_14245 [Candidatus Competibacteraceae bacterium]|nr:hypothetical protein [Candidatus Competibacteraceae bacterium]